MLEGNDRYEGYAVDLIDAIAKDLGFKYEFQAFDATFPIGAMDKKTKKWNGLIRKLLDQVGGFAMILFAH